MTPDQLAGAQWVTQVTDVTLVTTYEARGEKRQVQGATVTCSHKVEYNGVGYNGEPEVKRLDCKTEFFVPSTHVLPQVGDVIAVEFVTVRQGMDEALPALPLIDAQTALNGGDSTDSPEDGDATESEDADADA